MPRRTQRWPQMQPPLPWRRLPRRCRFRRACRLYRTILLMRRLSRRVAAAVRLRPYAFGLLVHLFLYLGKVGTDAVDDQVCLDVERVHLPNLVRCPSVHLREVFHDDDGRCRRTLDTRRIEGTLHFKSQLRRYPFFFLASFIPLMSVSPSASERFIIQSRVNVSLRSPSLIFVTHASTVLIFSSSVAFMSYPLMPVL